MATVLRTVKGVNRKNREVFDLALTVFYGGTTLGQCVQLNISQGSEWMALDRKGMQALKDQLTAVLAQDYEHLEER